jgi:hypothetical protein
VPARTRVEYVLLSPRSMPEGVNFRTISSRGAGVCMYRRAQTSQTRSGADATRPARQPRYPCRGRRLGTENTAGPAPGRRAGERGSAKLRWRDQRARGQMTRRGWRAGVRGRGGGAECRQAIYKRHATWQVREARRVRELQLSMCAHQQAARRPAVACSTEQVLIKY